MSKEDFVIGQSKVEDFWKFINERHSIYLKRKKGLFRPWTNDPIFLDWKFTNVFRELDRGTIAIRQVLKQLYREFSRSKNNIRRESSFSEKKKELDSNKIQNLTNSYIRTQFITCILYRMFGHHENCVFGPIYNQTSFYNFLRGQRGVGKQIFTGAYMQPSVKEEDKLVSFERVCREIVSYAEDIILEISVGNTINCSLEHAWLILQKYDLIGPFIAYEFVCDLRYTDILRNATDICTWCNIGPGAERGLKRMGFDSTLDNIKRLLHFSINDLSHGIKDHWVHQHYDNQLGVNVKYPYWELREIEHCLCEFDKYERIRLGQGRPRAKYNGKGVIK